MQRAGVDGRAARIAVVVGENDRAAAILVTAPLPLMAPLTVRVPVRLKSICPVAIETLPPPREPVPPLAPTCSTPLATRSRHHTNWSRQNPCARAVLVSPPPLNQRRREDVGVRGVAVQRQRAAKAIVPGLFKGQRAGALDVNRAAARAHGEQAINARRAAGVLQRAAVEHQVCRAVVRRADIAGGAAVGQRADRQGAAVEGRDASVGVGPARQRERAAALLVRPVLPPILFPALEAML